MNKENIVKLTILVSLLCLFLFGSRIKSENGKVICIEGKCKKPHNHGELGYHERFKIEANDNFAISVLKNSANFWESNGTGMTFAIIIGSAGLSLLLSWKKFDDLLKLKGVKGSAIGSLLGMPLNMCANCSAVASVSLTSKNGSKESTLGIIFGAALLNIIGIVTMFGLFSPAVVISRIVFSVIMILIIVPIVSKIAIKNEIKEVQSEVINKISSYYPEISLFQTIIKSFEDWLIAVGNLAYKLVPLMIIGTIFTAIFRVIFPNEFLHQIINYNYILILICISFIGTLLSVPVLFEILLGIILLHLGFSNGIIAAMVFTAPSFGLFTLVVSKDKLGGIKIPLILISITFVFGILAGLFADFLTKFF